MDEISGVSHLHIQDTTPGSALSTISNENLIKTATGHSVIWKEGVATMTIDDFSDSIGKNPTMIKIDVDGNELSILKGGDKTFKNPKLKTIFIEVGLKTNGCEGMLSDFGFTLKNKFVENQIWERT